MQTSEKGIEALALEEGDVLRAYRCPAGRLTIGMGLTAASGVIKPTPGMVITAQQSRDLTRKALQRNYEPRVTTFMPGAKQHEFDAGVLFDWNTGGIAKATWVPLWARKASVSAIAAKYRLWNKGGGKVLPGLVKRRERELRILFEASYPVVQEPSRPSVSVARWVLPMDFAEKLAAMLAFEKLGYKVGTNPGAIPAAEIRRFQSDHGLTIDGKIGRATLPELRAFGIRKSREWVHDELAWLREMGAVTTVAVGTIMVATLTDKGHRHLDREIAIEGIQRPSRPGG